MSHIIAQGETSVWSHFCLLFGGFWYKGGCNKTRERPNLSSKSWSEYKTWPLLRSGTLGTRKLHWCTRWTSILAMSLVLSGSQVRFQPISGRGSHNVGVSNPGTDKLISSSFDYSLKIWDTNQGVLLHRLQHLHCYHRWLHPQCHHCHRYHQIDIIVLVIMIMVLMHSLEKHADAVTKFSLSR